MTGYYLDYLAAPLIGLAKHITICKDYGMLETLGGQSPIY